MHLINRAVAAVGLKQPFVDWANSTPGPKFTLESLNRENHAFLLPEHDTAQELELIIQDLYRDIFQTELSSICRSQNLWPEINYQAFLDWFDIRVHSMVFDPYEEEIEKEEFLHY